MKSSVAVSWIPRPEFDQYLNLYNLSLVHYLSRTLMVVTTHRRRNLSFNVPDVGSEFSYETKCRDWRRDARSVTDDITKVYDRCLQKNCVLLDYVWNVLWWHILPKANCQTRYSVSPLDSASGWKMIVAATYHSNIAAKRHLRRHH